MEKSKFYDQEQNMKWMKSKDFPFKTDVKLQQNRDRKNQIQLEKQKKI